MSDTVPGFPLQWPIGWPRTPNASRIFGRFHTTGRDDGRSYIHKKPLTVAIAVDRVFNELRQMGIGDWNIVISSNIPLRLDGTPRSGQAKPIDPGVAVYWRENNDKRRVMAIDRYRDVEDNIAAIAATLNAMRAIERHGGSPVMERAFTGFDALPAPDQGKHWKEVLGVCANAFEVNLSYRSLASKFHPDKPGGSHEKMAELNKAREQALQEVK